MLERRGLVVRRRAKGTFVASPRVSQDLAELRSFHGGLLDRGVVPEMELLEFRPATAPPPFVRVFGQHDVMRLLRRYVVDGKPLAIADIYLHPMARSIAWETAERHDTYTIFERFLKVPVARASVTIRADAAGRAMARLLDLKPSSPVLLLVQTHHAASNEVLVCSSLRVRADAYQFHIDLPGGVTLRDGLTSATANRPTQRRS
jgi:GntR family transcriptional regulator